MSNRLRRKEDLRDSGLNVLAGYCDNKGYQPALERGMLDLKFLTEEKKLDSVFVSVLQEDEISKKVAEEWCKTMEQSGMKTTIGYHLLESAEDLKTLISHKGCLLVAEVGKTTYPQIEQQMKLCTRVQGELLGCIVIE